MSREMKVRSRLDGKPNAKFTDAATIIAKGAPPKWLLCGLDHFSTFVGNQTKTPRDEMRHFVKIIIPRMHDAADLLIKKLPMFQGLPVSVECPNEIAIALAVLPRVKEYLSKAMTLPSWADVRHKTCAVVVVEAWTLIRGKPNRLPEQLRSACREYWEACDGGDSGDDDWRRHVKEAAANSEYTWIRQILSAYKSR
jgi:hypothetical protein